MKLKSALDTALSNRFFYGAVVLFTLLQFIYIAIFHYSALVSDMGVYVYYAQQSAEIGKMYPNELNIHDSFVFNPGWVNFILLWIKIFGSVAAIPYANALFNALTAILCCKIAARLSGSEKTGMTAGYIFMLIPTFFSISLHLFSEPLFLAVALSSFYLCIKEKRTVCTLIAAGVMMGIAYWIRPMASGFVIGILLYYILTKKWRDIATYICSLVATCCLIGWATSLNFPAFVYTSNTGWYNMVRSCSDDADGSITNKNFEPGRIGFIEGQEEDDTIPVWLTQGREKIIVSTDRYTMAEVDSIYKTRCISWLKEHPFALIKQLPKKIKILTYPFTYFYRYEADSNDPEMLNMQIMLDKENLPFRILFWSASYIILFLALTGCFTIMWRSKLGKSILAIIIVNSVPTLAIAVAPRYFMVFMPFVYIIAACTIHNIYRIYKSSKTKNK